MFFLESAPALTHLFNLLQTSDGVTKVKGTDLYTLKCPHDEQRCLFYIDEWDWDEEVEMWWRTQ